MVTVTSSLFGAPNVSVASTGMPSSTVPGRSSFSAQAEMHKADAAAVTEIIISYILFIFAIPYTETFISLIEPYVHFAALPRKCNHNDIHIDRAGEYTFDLDPVVWCDRRKIDRL